MTRHILSLYDLHGEDEGVVNAESGAYNVSEGGHIVVGIDLEDFPTTAEPRSMDEDVHLVDLRGVKPLVVTSGFYQWPQFSNLDLLVFVPEGRSKGTADSTMAE